MIIIFQIHVTPEILSNRTVPTNLEASKQHVFYMIGTANFFLMHATSYTYQLCLISISH